MLCGKEIVKTLPGLSQMPSGACLEHFALSHFVWNVINGWSICCQSLCSCCLEYYSKMFTPQRCLMSGTSYSHLSLFLGGVTWTCSFSFFFTHISQMFRPARLFPSLILSLHMHFQGEFRDRFKSDWSEPKDNFKSSIFIITKYFQYHQSAWEKVKRSMTGHREVLRRDPDLFHEMFWKSMSEEH